MGDGLFAVVFSAAMVPGMWVVSHQAQATHWRRPDVFAVVLVLLQTLPLTFRREKPEAVLVTVGVATVTFYALGYPPSSGGIPALIALYTVAAWRPRGFRVWRALVPTAAGVTLSIWVSRSRGGLVDLIANFVVYGAAWAVGDNIRTRRAYTRSLEERAVRAEREQEALADKAVTAERARIARELHDVVAHSMSVMVVQAGAARRLLQRARADAGPDGVTATPPNVQEALESIESTGRDALSEMRRLLGVLRTDDQVASRPQPTVAELDGLVASLREAGLDVSLDVRGEPRRPSSGIELSAYRIVQEALTNTLKHAGPARAEVRLTWADDALEIEVLDDGRGPGLSGVAPGETGHGLLGMRERVAVFGGDLKVGPRRGGGYRVRARLPLPAGTP